MRIWLLSSGSSGNGAIVEALGTRLLIDAGLGPRTMAARMRQLGGELLPRAVDAILVTHEHGDHVAHLEPLLRALRAPVYLHAGVRVPVARSRYEVRTYERGDTLRIGALDVATLALPHDAPQVAVAVAAGETRFAIVTDLGHPPPQLAPLLCDCDEALLESNYCPLMMESGPYPMRLKQRVTGNYGHLANEQTAALAAELQGSRLRKLWLGHISLVNNTPDRALACVRAAAPGLEVDALPHGAPRVIDVRAGATSAPFAPRPCSQ
jgi:phosphoribosyl 1,2-cyclic phosphodiesterase